MTDTNIDSILDELRANVAELERASWPDDSPEARLIAGVRAMLRRWDEDVERERERKAERRRAVRDE